MSTGPEVSAKFVRHVMRVMPGLSDDAVREMICDTAEELGVDFSKAGRARIFNTLAHGTSRQDAHYGANDNTGKTKKGSRTHHPRHKNPGNGIIRDVYVDRS